MHFEFAENRNQVEEKQREWWISLSPEQRWKSNMAHLEVLMKWNPKFFEHDDNHFVLR